MMRLRIGMLIFVLTVCLMSSINGLADVYDIAEISLNNVVVPDDFGVCTLDSCDSEFKSMLKSFNHTYSDWVEKIMKPGNIYFYASNKKDENIYIQCEEIFFSESGFDSEKYDQYMYDYNLAGNDEEIELILDEYKKNLTETGVNERSIEMSFRPGGEGTPTCYIVSSYRTGGICVYEFHTIYAGREWTFFMSSPRELTQAKRQILEELVVKLEYKYKIDYTRTRVVIRQNNQVEEANEITTYDDSKDGRVVFLTTTITIVFLIIYIITDKQKKEF